jgi:hypothetical protein
VSVLLGVNAYPASGDAGARQARALESWRGLSGVRLANLQWPDEVFAVDGFATHPVLAADSRTASGRPGPRKPLVSEIFARLAEIAGREGCAWFGFANADIHWTQAAVDRVAERGLEAAAFSRMDVDPESGRELEMVTAGIDGFVLSVDWWWRHHRRFRGYVGGEPVWDNVYTAIVLRHARAELENRAPLLRHERHPAGDWRKSPFVRYVAYLAALDRLDFTRWAVYHYELLRMRERGIDPDAEDRLQREIFRRREPLSDRVLQTARALKARLAYLAARRERAA